MHKILKFLTWDELMLIFSMWKTHDKNNKNMDFEIKFWAHFL